MNFQAGLPAWKWLQTATAGQLATVIYENGEDDDPIMCQRIAEAALERQRRLGGVGVSQNWELEPVLVRFFVVNINIPIFAGFNVVLMFDFNEEMIAGWLVSWLVACAPKNVMAGPYKSTLELATCIQEWTISSCQW